MRPKEGVRALGVKSYKWLGIPALSVGNIVMVLWKTVLTLNP